MAAEGVKEWVDRARCQNNGTLTSAKQMEMQNLFSLPGNQMIKGGEIRSVAFSQE